MQQSVNLLMIRLFPLQPVPSYGTQTPHNNSHSVDVPMTEMHTHKDCMFEAMGDSVSERNAHTVYYNICQVWPVRTERLESGRVGSDGAWRRDGLCGNRTRIFFWTGRDSEQQSPGSVSHQHQDVWTGASSDTRWRPRHLCNEEHQHKLARQPGSKRGGFHSISKTDAKKRDEQEADLHQRIMGIWILGEPAGSSSGLNTSQNLQRGSYIICWFKVIREFLDFIID